MLPALILSGLGGTCAGVCCWKFLSNFRERLSRQRLYRRLDLMQIQSSPVFSAYDRIMQSRQARLSNLPSLRKYVAGISLSTYVLNLLEQAGSKMNVASFYLTMACGVVAAMALAVLTRMPPLPLLMLLPAVALTPFGFMMAKRKKRFLKISEQLIDAAHLISSAMRAGLSFEVGLNIVAAETPEPIQGEFRKLCKDWKLQADSRIALSNLSTRVPTADVRLFVACARLHREVGGNFAVLLDQLGQTIRERFQLWRELKALTAEGRFSGLVLGLMPIFTVGALMLMDSDYLKPLTDSPAGHMALWTAAFLQLAGFAAIRWLTTPRVR